MQAKDRIILPVDVPDVDQALFFAKILKGHVGMYKIGLEFIWSSLANLLLMSAHDAEILLHKMRQLAILIGGPDAFIDGKLCDIPNTVKGASVAIARLGVKFFNVHASSGRGAIKAAVAVKANSKVLGVTVLTSIDEGECVSIFGTKPASAVINFVRMLLGEGADGVICSPREVEIIRSNSEFNDLVLVTPGVRPEWAAAGDQKRVMTPGEAIKAGANYLVIGRPITKPPAEIGSPVMAAQRISQEIEAALA